MTQFDESVIPDEHRFAGRDPESREKSNYKIISGSRLASTVGGLGRDDEFRHSLLKEEEIGLLIIELCASVVNNRVGFRVSEGKVLLQPLPALGMFPHACCVNNSHLADKTGNERPGSNIEVYIIAMFLLPGPDFPA
jgi:hypothetical protein